MNLKMVLKGDIGPVMEDTEGFNLRTINNAAVSILFEPGGESVWLFFLAYCCDFFLLQELNVMREQAPEVVAESEDSDDDDTPKAKFERYEKGKTRLDKSGL